MSYSIAEDVRIHWPGWLKTLSLTWIGVTCMQSPASVRSDAKYCPSHTLSMMVRTIWLYFVILPSRIWQVAFYSQEIFLFWTMCQSTISRSWQVLMPASGIITGYSFSSCPRAPQNWIQLSYCGTFLFSNWSISPWVMIMDHICTGLLVRQRC